MFIGQTFIPHPHTWFYGQFTMDRRVPTSHPRDEVLRFLFSRIDYERTHVVPYNERQFKLDRMRELLAELGNPGSNIPIVHIAGTKGKGSTAAMIATALSAAGYRTGVYSSPHLHRLEERATVNGASCSELELVDLLRTIQPIVEAMDGSMPGKSAGCGPTFFEITTAMALLHFTRSDVDFAVLEVGLGGRLDSTNVCQPVASVITSISFDHTKQLGNTLAAISAEKAGIIKPEVPVISGVTQAEAADVIARVADSQGCDLHAVDQDFSFDYLPNSPGVGQPWLADSPSCLARIHYREARPSATGPYSMNDVQVGLPGMHQGANAAVALATLRRLGEAGYQIPDSAMRAGLAQVQCPARIEIFGDRPAWVVDAAHNVASFEALIATLDELFPGRPRSLVFATSKEKDIEGMLRKLLPEFEQVIFTRYAINPRSADPAELLHLANRIESNLDGETRLASRCLVEDPREAWNRLSSVATPEHVVCAAGSTFLASEIRPLVAGHQPARAS